MKYIHTAKPIIEDIFILVEVVKNSELEKKLSYMKEIIAHEQEMITKCKEQNGNEYVLGRRSGNIFERI